MYIIVLNLQGLRKTGYTREKRSSLNQISLYLF